MATNATEKEQPKLNDEKSDELYEFVKSCYTTAFNHKKNLRMGQFSLFEWLNKCVEQVQGVWDPVLKDKLEKMNLTQAYVNLTDLKVSALDAWLKDILNDVMDMPIIFEPTPIPELSEDLKRELATELMEQIMLMDGVIETPEQLQSLANNIKKKAEDFQKNKLKKKTSNMERLIKDQLIDGDFRSSFTEFIFNICVFPFAAFEGPIPEEKELLEWNGSSLSTKKKVIYKVNNINPNDFFFSPDSKNTQDGSYIIIRKYFTINNLYAMLDNSSYIQKNVKEIVEEVERAYIDNKLYNKFAWIKDPTNTIFDLYKDDIRPDHLVGLKFYGKCIGKFLKNYGIKGIEDRVVYEVVITTLGNKIIKIVVEPNSSVLGRPIFATTFQKKGMGFIGKAIPQLIRDVERAYHSQLRALVLNSSLSSGTIGEVDFSRVQEYADEKSMTELNPNTISIVGPNYAGGGQPAHYFHNIPNYSGAFVNAMEYFRNLADVITQIPAMIHGQPVGTGANRTFRGMSMLYGNSLKVVQSAINNIDIDVLQPMGKYFYNMNMLDKDVDDDVKGDSQVKTTGIQGIIAKEINRDSAIEKVQILANLLSTGKVPEQILSDAINELLGLMGYNVIDYENASSLQVGSEPTSVEGPTTEPQVSDGALVGNPMGVPPENTGGA